jgi:hypothetical protein
MTAAKEQQKSDRRCNHPLPAPEGKKKTCMMAAKE